MICEMCGKDVTFLRKVTIEGVLLEVCPECAKFGIESKKEVPKEQGPKPIISQRLEVREKRTRPRDVLEKFEKEDLVEDYAQRMCDLGSIVFGCFEGSDVRAVAELRKLAETWGQEAEAGFSIESTHQDLGIGTELMGRVIDSARNRGVQRLYLSCLLENRRMQAIARKYEAELRFEHGEVIGEIMPTGATYFSLMSEAVDDRVSFMLAVLDLQSRLVRVA